MIRAIVLLVLLLGASGAAWAEMRGKSNASGPSNNVSTVRHGYQSGTGP